MGHQSVGREAELSVLHELVERPRRAGALVVVGTPGIGKTTLWEDGLDLARERGFRVLSARASSAEAQLSFAALIDLLEHVGSRELDALPPPQRRALEVALLRAEPAGPAPEPRAIALGFLNALRALASDCPLLVAVDDVQWLDAPSAEALAFAARRLPANDVGWLLTKRPSEPSPLERALEARKPDRLELGPLSLGAVRLLLAEHLGLKLPRHLSRKVVDATLGNPLFALELGRELMEGGLPAIGDDLPVPDAIEELLGTRVARLRAPTRKALLAVALSAEPTPSQLRSITGTSAFRSAVSAGVLLVDGSRVRASHPLLAAAAKRHSQPEATRELHLELAGVVDDAELRARHLALGTEHADVALAGTVGAAAAAASSRGARQDAVELATHGLRLTPQDAVERPDRLLELADYLELAGEPQRVVELLGPELDALPAGEVRLRALIALAECAGSGGPEVMEYLERAIAESGDDPRLRTYVLPAMANVLGFLPVERMRDAEAWAAEAVPAAQGVAPGVEERALEMLAWTRALCGRSIDDVCERFRTVSGDAGYIGVSADRVEAQRLAWRGEVDQARAAHGRLLSLADERGEATSAALQRLHLCELELRAGRCEAAGWLIDEWDETSERDLLPASIYERCRALLDATRGRAADAEKWAAQAIAIAVDTGVGWNRLEGLRARGIASLLGHELGGAVDSLRAVWEHTEREGVHEPGVFPVAPDLVEALVETGDLDGARAVAERLRDLAEQQEHPWGRASAMRCDGLLRFAAGEDDEVAAAKLEEAIQAYEALSLRFDAARTLLLLGRAQRRRKRWAAAKRSLELAVAAFEELDASGWAEEARTELARVGARRTPPEGGLSPAEQRVAALAAEGHSNKEIAQALFVTVKTVETHLSRVYAKLGVRSRSQLAAHWSSRP